jgi:tetratricopeptide (TPR) repeat protein
MADSATGIERTFDSSAYTPSVGVDGGLRVPRAASSPDPLSELTSLLRLAAKKQEIGEDGEAEALLRRAVEIADGTLSTDDPDFVLLLTDLSRLYLKKSAFEAAEPILLRLFEIKRSKGDDHPEVATVLASLATVRQALGRHESAEQLWRRVLEIRERTLAPNHFAIVTALEHLAGACASRGKISEALNGFQRALSIRETTMGVDHPTLRSSRERIADLKLQGSEDSFDPGAASDVAVAPEKYRLLSGDGPSITPSEARSLIPTLPQERALTLQKPAVVIHGRFTDREAAASETPAPPTLTSADTPSSAMVAFPDVAQPESSAYLNILTSLRDELETTDEPESLADRSGAMVGAAMAFLSKKESMIGLVAVVVGLLSLAVLMDTRGVVQGNQLPALTSVAAAESPRVVPIAPVNLGTNAVAVAAVPAENGKNGAAARSRVVEERTASTKKVSEKKDEIKPVAMPGMSTALLASLESVGTKAASNNQVAESIYTPTQAPLTSGRSVFSTSEPAAVPLRARLIGDLPTPRVPPQVADVEGEVRVRFNVDVDGRPMMSTLEVLNSPNPLLATAVRKVIPTMRFEPARTGGADPKAIVDVVQIGFQFAKGR